MADIFTPREASLEPAAEIAVPGTPIPGETSRSVSPDAMPYSATVLDKSRFNSPSIPTSSAEMTPPPSQNGPHSFLASPPATVNHSLCVAYGAAESLPSATEIENASAESLRTIAKDLLAVAQESRMSAAHFKLQHSLLSMTSSEAIKRAEVEQQLARREIEILQSAEYRSRHTLLRHLSPPPHQGLELENAICHIKDLEEANATLERRLRRAKKLIEEDADKYELLKEENDRLKKRIRDNRDHLTRMIDRGSLPASSPRTEFNTPHRRTIPRYPDSARSQVSRVGSHDPFAALLAADQVLNGEPTMVKSPLNKKDIYKTSGHIRGTHSLSSLPVTPQRKVMGSERIHFFTPINKRSAVPPPNQSFIAEQSDRDRHDRDSTISASEAEEALTDEDVPASQASSLATSMLRRFPPNSQEEPSIASNIGKSSHLLQTKLFGHVRKAGVDRPVENFKRKRSFEGKAISPKRFRGAESTYADVEP